MGLRTSWSRGWHPHEQEGIIGDAEVRAYITKVAAPESLLAERVAMLPKRNSFFSIKSFYTCTLKTLSSLWLENIQNEVVIEWTSCGVDVWYSMNCNVTRWCPDVESVRGLAFYFLTPCSESQQTLSCTCFWWFQVLQWLHPTPRFLTPPGVTYGVMTDPQVEQALIQQPGMPMTRAKVVNPFYWRCTITVIKVCTSSTSEQRKRKNSRGFAGNWIHRNETCCVVFVSGVFGNSNCQKAICWCLRISRSVSPCWVCAMKACECPIVRPGIEAFENETFSLPKDSCS